MEIFPHELLVKTIFGYVVISGMVGILGNIYGSVFRKINTTFRSENKMTRFLFKYFLFSADYFGSFLLVTALVLYPIAKNSNMDFGEFKYYIPFIAAIPFAIVVAHFHERMLCRISPAA